MAKYRDGAESLQWTSTHAGEERQADGHHERGTLWAPLFVDIFDSFGYRRNGSFVQRSTHFMAAKESF